MHISNRNAFSDAPPKASWAARVSFGTDQEKSR